MTSLCVRRLRGESGIALLLSMFMTLALSVVAASLMFLAQTETYSTMNYRMMSQARYGAEAGLQLATNFLMYSYTPPSTGGADSLANYVTTSSPVTYNGKPVILSANSSVASNYPVAAVQASFASLKSALPAGSTSVGYAPYATLISMEEVSGGNSVTGAPFTIQTWQITADGTIAAGARNAEVEVTGTIDTQKLASTSATLNYGAFATAATCGALTFSGGASTKSYNSQAPGFNPAAAISLANGDLQTSCTAAGADTNCNKGSLGTNGNLSESGGATINGTLSTPRVGVGSCSSGNVDAESSSGGANVTGGLVTLPQALTLATPNIATPNLGSPPASTITVTGSTTCAMLVAGGLIPAANCSGSAGNLTFSGALTLGNISVSNSGHLTIASGTYTLNAVSVSGAGTLALGGGTVDMATLSTSGGGSATLGTGTYNTGSVAVSGGTSVTVNSQSQVTMNIVNTISLSGGGSLNIPSDTGLATQAAIYMNMVNTPSVATPIDFSGGSVLNNSYDSSRIQIEYGGTGTIKLSGGTEQAEVIYAPKATASFSGGAALYGEVIASTISDSGGATIYYDRNLATKGLFSTTLYQPGDAILSSFTWNKF